VPSRGLAVILGLALGACSLSLDGPDPQRPRSKPPECDTGKGLVALDVVVGSGFALGGLAVLDNGGAESSAIPLAISGLYLLAALHGNNTANACRSAMAEFTDRATLEPPRTATRPPRVKQQPAPAAPPQAQPQLDDDAADDAPLQPAKQQPPPPAPASAKQAPAPKPEPSDDRWRDFWKELP